MNLLLEYVSQNYMTLMLLAGLTVILIANRKTKINGVQYVWGIMGIVLVLTICEYIEIWCDTYNKDYHILFPKTMLVYWLFPMTALLEIYLVVPIKRKLLLAVPQIINMLLTFVDLFGTGIVYNFHENHAFIGGILRPLPLIVVGFYVVFLTICSIQFISHGSKSKGMVVVFMAISTLITIAGEYTTFAEGYTESIAAMDMLVYYFYLAAIHQREVQEKLHQRELELERSKQELEQHKLKLLVAQIQPHFIYNSLLALQAKSINNPVVYEGIRSFGKYLRANFTALTENELIPFGEELKNIKAYLQLEQLNFGEKLKVEYDIDFDDFMIPALSVEPLVENAVRYGVGTYQNGGLVQIIVRDDAEYIIIEVKDDGSGGNKLTDKQKNRKSIGLENVRLRLKALNKGELSVTQNEHGTTAMIRLKYIEIGSENDDNTNN